MKTADGGALMADHHLGYSVPIGGVLAYKNHISPSGVGYDIGCGNKAVLTDLHYADVKDRMSDIMDRVFKEISFGVGRNNATPIEHPLFDLNLWEDPAVVPLKDMARAQLGTVGSGNHYVDIFKDEQERIWVGCHFGSRGLGHKTATHFLKAGGAKDGIDVEPLLLDVSSELGQRYINCMKLAGAYAYAGRDYVCDHVVQDILGTHAQYEVHNHHNFAWQEFHDNEALWVVRKGATPAFPGQTGFVGGTMGENSVILEGVDSQESRNAFYSTVHGAGRIMSRTEAAGKSRWIGGVKKRISEGKISQQMMKDATKHIELRGAGLDEAPQAYKRLPEVLAAQGDTIRILHQLTPIGVAMAGANEFDPYKD
jgi:tRNA-splicing ligase RtcB